MPWHLIDINLILIKAIYLITVKTKLLCNITTITIVLLWWQSWIKHDFGLGHVLKMSYCIIQVKQTYCMEIEWTYLFLLPLQMQPTVSQEGEMEIQWSISLTCRTEVVLPINYSHPRAGPECSNKSHVALSSKRTEMHRGQRDHVLFSFKMVCFLSWVA